MGLTAIGILYAPWVKPTSPDLIPPVTLALFLLALLGRSDAVLYGIALAAPISGMSMNPARTFGSALLPQLWDSLWIYFLAPPLGMMAAAAVYLRQKHAVGCAKLHHQNRLRCIFCEYQAARQKEIP